MKDCALKEELSPTLDRGRNILDELLREGAKKMRYAKIYIPPRLTITLYFLCLFSKIE